MKPAHLCRLAALLCSLGAVACDGWDDLVRARGANQSTAEEGEPFEVEIEGARTCPLPEHLDPKNVRIVSYRVRLRGNHPGRVPANYFYASLLTSDGDRYLASYEGCSPVLLSDPLAPGETARGLLNFPIPPSKTPELLTYAPELIGMSSLDSTRELHVDERLSEAAGMKPGEDPEEWEGGATP